MNERIKELILKAGWKNAYTNPKEGFEVVFEGEDHNLACIEKFAELIKRDMHRTAIASILITDIKMEEKGLVPTSEDYISAINHDFGIKNETKP